MPHHFVCSPASCSTHTATRQSTHSAAHLRCLSPGRLRDKYCVDRRDVYSPGESRWEEDDDDEGSNGNTPGDSPGGGDSGDGPSGDRIAGRRSIPGIDMSSLD